ncbi:chemotaxis protein CheW [Marinobacterium marinum]|uniref:Chemotaxis protein CheW n=1 Tax=Marinobacterium marinum TaxID=2756129 RepID=A0A7W1WY99_9GAMM|nr:chemotaxis protein CheW [Marinobacterium marinum]MBA4502267.1 chemotaxis protein CheW [Marinobacterium marinum]
MSLNAAAELLKTLQDGQRAESEHARRTQQEEIAYHQWATFRVDNELYGIDVMQVKEVLRFSEITPVPGADSSILGIINLRGNVVTVIDTRQTFGLPLAPYDDDTRVIVVEFNEQEVIGLVVDSVDEVINLPQKDVDRAPSISGDDSSKRFVQGVCYHNNILIILLDLGKMLLSITPLNDDDVTAAP